MALSNITWPTSLQPASCDFGRVRAEVELVSPSTRRTQVIRKGQPLWRADVTWKVRAPKTALLRYLIDGLEGQAGGIMVPHFGLPLSAIAASPIVQSTTAAGATSVPTFGWPFSVRVLNENDFVQLGRRLYVVTANVDSNGSGVATIPLMTPLRTAAAASSPVIFIRPGCEMRLTSREWSGERSSDEGLWSLSAQFLETVTNVS